MSTAEMSSAGGGSAVVVVVGWRRGKEREKKERGPPGKAETRRRRRGEVAVEGQVRWQTVAQRWCWVERERSWEEAQLAAARVGPSRRVRMWVVRMSAWRSERVVAPPPAVAEGGGEELDILLNC